MSSRNLQVIIGDMDAESALYAAVIGSKPKSDGGPVDVKTSWDEIERSLPDKAISILKTYGAESNNCSAGQLMSATLQIISDLSFRRASGVEAERLIKRGIPVYRYVFDQGSPFPGPFRGQAAHSLDLNYSFGSPRIFHSGAGVANPELEGKIQQNMQEKWIAFANGEVPWRVQSEDCYYAFGPDGFDGEIAKKEFEQRRKPERWAAFGGLGSEELIKFGIACNKAFTELSGHRL